MCKRASVEVESVKEGTLSVIGPSVGQRSPSSIRGVIRRSDGPSVGQKVFSWSEAGQASLFFLLAGVVLHRSLSAV